jgi:hypothetical protein
MPKKKIELNDEAREFFREQGANGGTRAAARMTKKARKQRAQKAIAARWAKAKKEGQ